MVNWPGWNGGSASATGFIRTVTESWVWTRRSTTRYGTGSIASRSSLTRAPIQVEQPLPGALQPRQQNLDEPQGQRVAKRRILLRQRPQHRGIQMDRRDRPVCRSGEVPVVRWHEPRPAQHVAGAEGLHHSRATAGERRLQRDLARAEQPPPRPKRPPPE